MYRWLVVDCSEHLVNNGKGMRSVVVVGAPPTTRRLGRNDFVDLVEIENSPPLARIGVEGSGARLPAGLVAEDHRPSR